MRIRSILFCIRLLFNKTDLDLLVLSVYVYCNYCRYAISSDKPRWKVWGKNILLIKLKGTVSREKLFTWGLGEMDWTLTIDRTWVLHFSDQLFNCYNFLTVHCLVKPVWWLSETVALHWLIWRSDVAVSCLLCLVVAVCTLILCFCCSPHPNAVLTATIHCYRRKQLIHDIFSVLLLQSAP